MSQIQMAIYFYLNFLIVQQNILHGKSETRNVVRATNDVDEIIQKESEGLSAKEVTDAICIYKQLKENFDTLLKCYGISNRYSIIFYIV